MKQGDTVLVTYEGRTLKARVHLASPNGRSLVIVWDDGMLGGHCGMMPIMQDEGGGYRSLIEGLPVILIQVVPDKEAEKIDFAVCVRAGTPTPFTDNETGVCAHCGHAIIFRPHMPKGPTKICVECVIDTVKGGHA